MTIEELLNNNNIETAPEDDNHFRHGWVNIECPFCERGSGAFHLGINEDNVKRVNCYRCGPKSLWNVLIELLPKSSRRDIAKFVEDMGAIVGRGTDREQKTGKYTEPLGVGKLLEAHKMYLTKRNLNWKELKKVWKIRGIGPLCPLQWRIYIPIMFRGEPVSWTTRSINPDAKLRYLSASLEQESVHHKSLLYGEDYVGTSIIVQEGAFGVFTIGPGSTATLGTGYTRKQLLRISQYPVRYVLFDNEPVAQQRARQLCRALSPFPGKTENIQIDAKDTNEASKKEIRLIQKLIGR